MEEAQKLLYQKEWRVIDQSMTGLHMNPLQSFGLDDTLCASVGTEISPATARAWVHRPVVVLGIQDTKLPFLEDGLAFLKSAGFDYILRNSGGLAVALDEGVLNLTLVFPEAKSKIHINRGYDAMLWLVKEMFFEYGDKIAAGEIVGSYCPGSYDLSIGGKKFAGISQRRLKSGVAVQIYLCVTGSGGERAELIRGFYSHSKKGTETKFAFPEINCNVMASLSELFGTPLTIETVMQRFLEVLRKNSDHLYSGSLTEEELSLYEGYYRRIVERNKKGVSPPHR